MSEPDLNIPHAEVLRASESGDVKRLVDLFTSDAVVMPPNDTTVYGSEEILWWWEEYFKSFKVISTVETERDTFRTGNQFFVRASFSVSIAPKNGGPSIQDDIRSLTVWRMEPDGTWKISHQIWNSTKPVGSGTNRYMHQMIQKKNSGSPA